MNSPARVGRPPGLSLAILMAVVFFSVLSLLKVYIAWRFSDCPDDVSYDCAIDFIPFDAIILLQGALGIVVLVLAVLAWRGRPPMVRFWLQGAVFLMVLLVIAEIFIRRSADPVSDPGELVIVSGREAYIAVLSQQVFLQVMAALYIFWYCNRAPARAFYRQEPLGS